MDERESYNHCTRKFIDLANELKDQKIDPKIISAGLMSASGTYATYVSAGNTGGLESSGVDKVVAMYRSNLENIQKLRKKEYEKAAS